MASIEARLTSARGIILRKQGLRGGGARHALKKAAIRRIIASHAGGIKDAGQAVCLQLERRRDF